MATCFRFAAYATPVRAIPSRQPGRFHNGREAEPTQYLSLHPLGPLAELMRAADLRTVEQLRAVSVRTWALQVSLDDLQVVTFDSLRRAGFRANALIADEYGEGQRFAGQLRARNWPPGMIVPSAALPGTRNVVLFGPRVAAPYRDPYRAPQIVDVPASITAEGAHPLGSLLQLVRFRGQRHAEYDAWQAGVEWRFREPDWALPVAP